ncbi:Patatin-like phospholipase domain-containing protein 1 [Tetrabaena socialis]|uniref:Patatin n=1 Tax=Tetrabaena socialis TaxID=47790 RepID=A0A2J8AH98_9CHLO|nr:Patatin-like phospholipase domain-containing protein 1 [Tetrabaena socialis]|eukprot:PNH11898.1 Patatin-like phospholipase domain-containing protein 1 [Tetrabaena socialis]
MQHTMLQRQQSGVQASTSCSQRCVAPHPAVTSGSRRHAPARRAHSSASARASTIVSFQNADSAALPAPATMLLDSPTASKPKPATTLSWAGAGIFFFWQLGAMKFLSERYDLTRVPMAGASGGALASVLAACGVPADEVLQRAYDLSVKYGIWERPLGLVGVWGSLIEQWLDDLLPDDAAERCRGKITIIVTTLPNMAQVGISDFKDKKDLITAAMASSHIPMLLDLKFARLCRGKYCVDGSFPDFFYNDNSDLLKAGGSAVIFDYFNDAKLVRKGRMDMLSLKKYEEVKHIMQLGYEYAAQLHQEGHFDHFEVGEVVFDHLEEAVKKFSEPAQNTLAPAAAAAQQQA